MVGTVTESGGKRIMAAKKKPSSKARKKDRRQSDLALGARSAKQVKGGGELGHIKGESMDDKHKDTINLI